MNDSRLCDGHFVLRDLVSFRQVGVEVLFSIEPRVQVQLTAKCQSERRRSSQGIAVGPRESTWKSCAHRTDVCVRFGTIGCRACTEGFGLRGELHVRFHTDDGFVVVAGTRRHSHFRSVSSGSRLLLLPHLPYGRGHAPSLPARRTHRRSGAHVVHFALPPTSLRTSSPSPPPPREKKLPL